MQYLHGYTVLLILCHDVMCDQVLIPQAMKIDQAAIGFAISDALALKVRLGNNECKRSTFEFRPASLKTMLLFFINTAVMIDKQSNSPKHQIAISLTIGRSQARDSLVTIAEPSGSCISKFLNASRILIVSTTISRAATSTVNRFEIGHLSISIIMPRTKSATSKLRHDLDNLRTFLTGPVIYHHTAIVYGGPGSRIFKSQFLIADLYHPCHLTL